jgi:hypothetical protein
MTICGRPIPDLTAARYSSTLGQALSPGTHYCLGYQNGDSMVPFIPDPHHILYDSLEGEGGALEAREIYRSQTKLDLHVLHITVSEVE